VSYAYTYINSQINTLINTSTTNSINISNLALSYQLQTNYYQLFLFVNDVLNTPLNAEISNSHIAASCNGSTLGIGNGYFIAPACTNNLTIVNNLNNVVLYQSAYVAP
jgi:hypothetical protein